MALKLYLSGEIHTDWRDQIIAGAAGLDVTFSAPVTDHDASDNCGVAIFGDEPNKIFKIWNYNPIIKIIYPYLRKIAKFFK